MHDCIHCGGACYCHGDIDDCVVETLEHSAEHCVGCGCPEGEEDPDVFGIDCDDADIAGITEEPAPTRCPHTADLFGDPAP